MDWYTRRVLSWRISNTMDSRFCIEAVEEALRTLLRLRRQEGIRRLRGKLDWQGDLNAMRSDR